MTITQEHTIEPLDERGFWKRWYLMVLVGHVLVMCACYLFTCIYHPVG